MGVKYGVPFSRPAQVNRWLRRGTDGLAAGRSEAVAPVSLGRGKKGKGRQGNNGPGGVPGPPAVTDLERPWQGVRRLPPAGSNFGAGSTLFLSGSTTRPSPPDFVSNAAPFDAAGADLGTVPYAIWENTNGDTSGGAVILSNLLADPLQVGQGNGRGGFLVVWQWSFITGISGTRFWFAGVTGSEFFSAGQPSAILNDQINIAGVGQFGDAGPCYKHNDGTGTVTSVSSGLSNVATAKLYEARIFADPQTTSVQMSLESWTAGVSDGRVSHTATSNLPTWDGLFGFSRSLGAYLILGAGSDGGPLQIGMRGLFVSMQPYASATIDD